MKWIIAAIVAFLIAWAAYLSYEPGDKPALPPGYQVVCSLDGDKYSLLSRAFVNGQSANVWDSEKGAIRFAIYWEKVKDRPYVVESERYEWVDCKEGE